MIEIGRIYITTGQLNCNHNYYSNCLFSKPKHFCIFLPLNGIVFHQPATVILREQVGVCVDQQEINVPVILDTLDPNVINVPRDIMVFQTAGVSIC